MRLAVPLALIALALGACASSSNKESKDKQRYALGVPVWAASCAEWKKATPEARKETLVEMEAVRRQQLSGRNVGRGYGSVLEDDVAYRLFDDRCRAPGSESFLLYRLYGFAAGFVGQPGE